MKTQKNRGITMILKFTLTVVVAMLCMAFTRPNYNIQGMINAKDGTKIWMKYNYKGKLIIDSAIVTANVFKLSGYFPEPVLCTLSNSANGQIKVLLGEKSRIIISGECDKFYDLLINNSKEHDLYFGFRNKLMSITGEFREEIRRTGESNNNQTSPASTRLYKRLDSLSDNFITTNNNTTAAVLAIIDRYLSRSGRKAAEAYFKQLSPEKKSSFYADRIVKFVGAGSIIQVGNKAPEFLLKDIQGKDVKLSSFYGKYVLLDFWASWCGPCRQEHPFLIKLYKKHASDKFEFVSISMDGDDLLWRKAVKTDALTWTQLNEPNAMNSELSDVYGVKVLPFNCIIDPHGVIVATGLRGERLESMLNKLNENR